MNLKDLTECARGSLTGVTVNKTKYSYYKHGVKAMESAEGILESQNLNLKDLTQCVRDSRGLRLVYD